MEKKRKKKRRSVNLTSDEICKTMGRYDGSGRLIGGFVGVI